ncbi:DUF3265 domain-containing protein [Vibrio vulnificus]|nr:DUF3265 domain-containing protein [Vibrio vulnificus]EIF5019734.1 DUF3265 domain-containing protein [Vibrio vulnificus]EIO2325276.1 DUF3265 domain-containing protein [Vibrio vulnificus]EIO4070144.1 DUF3265 domain-containing protein [Vibrio vulnificus]ELH0905472.1 DUF3265 domain-containing protein [Vibrio vulnificus]
MTRRSRGIHAAWHFWYAVVFGGESGLRKVGLCGIHPLTQRYVYRRVYGKRTGVDFSAL